MSKTIQVKITEDGKVEMDYNGYKGRDCEATHASIMKRLNNIGVMVDAKTTVSTPKYTVAEANKIGARESK